MNTRNQQLLEEEIENELMELKNVPFSDESYDTVVEGVTKLMDRAIELKKLETEQADKIQARQAETELAERRLEEEKRDRVIGNIIAGLTLVATVALPVWGTVKSLKFEETGTVTTMSGKAWFNKLFPKK